MASELRSPWLTPVLSGVVAGACETTLNYPLDVVKTLRQTNPSINASAFSVVSQRVAEHGALGMYRGLSPMLFFFPAAAAIRFSVYGNARSALDEQLGSSVGDAPRSILAAMAASLAVNVSVGAPAETIMVTLVTDQAAGAQRRFHGGAAATSLALVRETGIRGASSKTIVSLPRKPWRC